MYSLISDVQGDVMIFTWLKLQSQTWANDVNSELLGACNIPDFSLAMKVVVSRVWMFFKHALFMSIQTFWCYQVNLSWLIFNRETASPHIDLSIPISILFARFVGLAHEAHHAVPIKVDWMSRSKVANLSHGSPQDMQSQDARLRRNHL